MVVVTTETKWLENDFLNHKAIISTYDEAI